MVEEKQGSEFFSLEKEELQLMGGGEFEVQ